MNFSITSLLLLLLNTLIVFYYLPTGAVVTGVLDLYKAFPKRYSFLKSQETKVALSNISASLSLHVTSFVGPSGSGKSTLAKVISGVESPTSGRVLNTTIIQSSLLDHLFRQSYDSSQTLNSLKRLQNPAPSFHELYEECIDLLQIPCNERIDSLLESQRKSVELLLSIFSRRYNTELPFFLVLDEYFDKDILSVRERIYKNLQLLCHHPVVPIVRLYFTTDEYSAVVHRRESPHPIKCSGYRNRPSIPHKAAHESIPVHSVGKLHREDKKMVTKIDHKSFSLTFPPCWVHVK
eukprot:gene21528-27875_t